MPKKAKKAKTVKKKTAKKASKVSTKKTIKEKTAKKKHKFEDQVRAYALSFPEVSEEYPWGHSAFKIKKKKVFLFLSTSDSGQLNLSFKLPKSNSLALNFTNCEPTGYGLGKSGWVSMHHKSNKDQPLSMIKSFIKESYLALAPKTLAKQLEG